MFAFLTRRLQIPDPPGTPTTDAPKPAPAVRLRFRTRGGAEVHVHDDGTVRCQGCDYDSGCGWRSPVYASGDANSHAEGCYSMPKPTRDA